MTQLLFTLVLVSGTALFAASAIVGFGPHRRRLPRGRALVMIGILSVEIGALATVFVSGSLVALAIVIGCVAASFAMWQPRRRA